MAQATTLAVESGWAGDRKRNLVGLTLASTNADTVTPQQVGLTKIDAIVDPGVRTGTLKIAGVTVTLTDHGTGPTYAWATNVVTVTVETVGNGAYYFYGW
jgi:hypothetical protein